MRAENFIAFFTVCGFFIGLMFVVVKTNEPMELILYTLLITFFFYLVIHIVIMNYVDANRIGRRYFNKDRYEEVNDYLIAELALREKKLEGAIQKTNENIILKNQVKNMNELKQKQLDAYQKEIKKSQDELVLSYMPALRAMAFRLKSRLPSSIEVNDLISVGATAMVKLSRTYDKEQNDSFWGYVKQRVYGSMIDYLRGLDFLSRGNRKLVKDIDNAINEYFNKFECEPDDAYLAKILGEDEAKIREARNLSDVSATFPIDEQSQLLSESDTESKIEKDELIQKITDVLNEFGEREQMIIQLYYYEELSLKEISDILGITESRISQIHKRLITKIRERLGF